MVWIWFLVALVLLAAAHMTAFEDKMVAFGIESVADFDDVEDEDLKGAAIGMKTLHVRRLRAALAES